MRLKRIGLTVAEYAALTGQPRSTVYDHARAGTLPVRVVRSGSTYRLSRVDTEALFGPVVLPDDPPSTST
jgi:excisionase family DNA binding protein